MTDHALARFHMVEGQVKPNKVTDEGVVAAMSDVPRELFVPKAVRGVAYVDEDIQIAPDRYLVEPMVIARLLNEATVRPGDIALDIGCATGYSTALLARLASTVVAVEQDAEMVAQASATLQQLGVDNAVVVEADPTAGYPQQAPYDVIMINNSVPEVPATLLDQLADGGRLVTVLSDSGHLGRAVLYRRFGETVSSRDLFDASTPTQPAFARKPAFEF
ncbi:MAG: methyltransferase domain-containing protein [Deinococcus-Thermus bacterium]|jgi:protein-L-isoaspartate(D-aspartate) O-methyltransferase|nr:methyltransferase domain-containing protein [Deinococcota bacterium]